MNEHAGPACALSVLIVGAFAILLHDKNGGVTPLKPTRPTIARESPEPDPSDRVNPPPPSRLETTLVAPPPKNSPIPEKSAAVRGEVAVGHEVRPSSGQVERASLPGPPGAPPSRGPDNRPRAGRASGGFTVVEAGETLADVAARVYGSGRAAESLWKANRDQLASPGSPLQRGTLLRTP